MRGKYYVWTGGLTEKEYRVHLWIGNDPMCKQSIWAEQFKEDQVMGASLPETVFDELVVMRYAELQAEGKVAQAEKRAMRKYGGNVGCMALCKQHGKPTALDRVEKRIKEK
jgi:hypothetical protein